MFALKEALDNKVLDNYNYRNVSQVWTRIGVLCQVKKIPLIDHATRGL